MQKQRRESIAQFAAAGRDDLAATEQFEIDVLRDFAPPPLAPAEVDSEIEKALAATGAQSPRDMGKVMAGAASRASPVAPIWRRRARKSRRFCRLDAPADGAQPRRRFRPRLPAPAYNSRFVARMKIAILQTGQTRPQMLRRFGPYPDMFTRLLGAADPARSNDSVFDREGRLPAADFRRRVFGHRQQARRV